MSARGSPSKILRCRRCRRASTGIHHSCDGPVTNAVIPALAVMWPVCKSPQPRHAVRRRTRNTNRDRERLTGPASRRCDTPGTNPEGPHRFSRPLYRDGCLPSSLRCADHGPADGVSARRLVGKRQDDCSTCRPRQSPRIWQTVNAWVPPSLERAGSEHASGSRGLEAIQSEPGSDQRCRCDIDTDHELEAAVLEDGPRRGRDDEAVGVQGSP